MPEDSLWPKAASQETPSPDHLPFPAQKRHLNLLPRVQLLDGGAAAGPLRLQRGVVLGVGGAAFVVEHPPGLGAVGAGAGRRG